MPRPLVEYLSREKQLLLFVKLCHANAFALTECTTCDSVFLNEDQGSKKFSLMGRVNVTNTLSGVPWLRRNKIAFRHFMISLNLFSLL